MSCVIVTAFPLTAKRRYTMHRIFSVFREILSFPEELILHTTDFTGVQCLFESIERYHNVPLPLKFGLAIFGHVASLIEIEARPQMGESLSNSRNVTA